MIQKEQTIEVPGHGSIEMLPYKGDERVRITKHYSSMMSPSQAITLSREEAEELARALLNWVVMTTL